MICAMATTTARAGRLPALVRAALDHAVALRQQPGCVAAYVLTERGTSVQVSVSLFETEEALERALEATRPVIARHALEQLREGPSAFTVFDVR